MKPLEVNCHGKMRLDNYTTCLVRFSRDNLDSNGLGLGHDTLAESFQRQAG